MRVAFTVPTNNFIQLLQSKQANNALELSSNKKISHSVPQDEQNALWQAKLAEFEKCCEVKARQLSREWQREHKSLERVTCNALNFVILISSFNIAADN